jgi:hypothetical protein
MTHLMVCPKKSSLGSVVQRSQNHSTGNEEQAFIERRCSLRSFLQTMINPSPDASRSQPDAFQHGISSGSTATAITLLGLHSERSVPQATLSNERPGIHHVTGSNLGQPRELSHCDDAEDAEHMHELDTDEGGDRDGQPQPVAEFLYQLTKMLTDDNTEVIEYSDARIKVHDPQRLEGDILHRYFRHSKFASFQRQLNYFGFRKIAGKGKMSAW